MFKKAALVLTGLFIFLGFAPVSFAHVYEDVPRESDYFYPIDYLRRNDVFRETRLFQPETLISKAEFIKYLVLLNSPEFKPDGSADLPFEDTRNNAWYAGYFEEAIELGILDARKTKIEPTEKLTVVDALKLLFHSQSIPIPNVYKGTVPYKDVARNTRVTALVMRALQLDLIRPVSDANVGIYQRVTRKEAARMIYKLDLATLGTPTSNGLPSMTQYGRDLQKIIDVWSVLEGSYYGGVDSKSLSDAALKAMIEELDDPYSVYLNAEENGNFTDSLRGDLEGIGAVVGYNDDDELAIISPLDGSPAERAGLRAKDVIKAVDGQSIEELTLVEVVGLIKGPKGTDVDITVKRGRQSLTLTVTRDIIIVESIEYDELNNGIHYIKVSQFGYETGDDFANVAALIERDADTRGILIDLRGNPGGVLVATTQMLGHFVEAQDEILSIRYKDYSQVLLSRGRAELQGIPLVVMIDEGSASGSEIMAGTLQDYDYATIVGSQSFGKGSVQDLTEFLDNSSLKYTVGQWFTPSKQDIAENGITPDVLIEDNAATDSDEQLDRALDELTKLIN